MRLALIAALLITPPAYAQITPDDLLASWQRFASDTDSEFNVERVERSGNTLTLINVDLGNDPAGPVQWVMLDGQADGSVDISFSRNLENITSTEELGGFSSTSTSSLKGLTLNAAGTPEAILYRFSIASISSNIIEVLNSAPNTIDLGGAGISGELRHQSGEGTQSFTGFIEADSLTARNRIESPDPKLRSRFDWSIKSPRLDLDVALPNDIGAISGGRIPESLRLSTTLTSGPYVMQIAQGDGAVFNFTYQSGVLVIGVDARQATYGFSSEQANITLQTASTPEFGVDIEAAAFELKFPFRQSDAAQDFSIATRVTGLGLGADSWQQLDPDATLSRAAASFGFAVTGTVKILTNLYDDAAISVLNGPPFELRSLSLNGMSLDFDGFGLSGNGALTFSPGIVDPMSGLPEPRGVLDFSLVGALALLDKIGALGWVEPVFVIGAKGAMGMFASPGKDADSFTTSIEFLQGGRININGQQVR